MKKHVAISVRELVARICRRGDLTGTTISPRQPALSGIRAHQALQKRRDAVSEAELEVSFRIEGRRTVLDIHGRIDCIFAGEGLTTLEEIKTTAEDLRTFMAANRELHWAQAKTYAAMYALDRGLEYIEIQLTYFQLETQAQKYLKRTYKAARLKAFLEELCSAYLDWLDEREEFNTIRNESIMAAEFPYAALRPGQMDMIQSIYETIKAGGRLLIQAPTGIGKTVAALFPAFKALAEGHTEKIFYLTARTTGRIIAEKTVDFMIEKGCRIRSITLTAKEKICLNPDHYCIPEECVYARGYFDRVNAARLSLLTIHSFTMDVITAIAREHTLCPFELSLDFALGMDCIIADFNYAFDPRVALKRFFENARVPCTFLVDEAHNLVDRSRSMFSAVLSRSKMGMLRRLVDDPDSPLHKSAAHIESLLSESLERSLEGDLPPWTDNAPQEYLGPVQMLCDHLEKALTRIPRPANHRDLAEHYFDGLWFLKVAEKFDDTYRTCLGRSGGDFTLSLFCTDPSPQLEAALDKSVSSIHFSATLTPLPYFARILGCGEEAQTQRLPSPFPKDNQCLLLCDSVSTLFRDRNSTGVQLARTIHTFTRVKKGNYLVFFPSYEYMSQIHRLYTSENPDHEVMIQKRRMSESERLEFLRCFRRENSRTLVGFVVMGGIFGEGIDLGGDRLSGAVIVGVGLPQISVEREVIHNHFSDRDEPGFQYAYLYPGMTRVFQAAGRVIRSETDRGAVLLVDPRYARPEYTSLFPSSWDPVHVTTGHEIESALIHFWNGTGRSAFA